MIPWHPISQLPDALKDGRELLLWDGAAVVDTWSARGAHFGMGEPGWSECHEGSALDGVTHYAEITAPLPDRTFVFRDGPTDTLKLVIAPAETLRVGDVVILDRDTGKIRRALPEDTGQKFTVPPGSRVTGDGYLEMPQ